jgi:hypothetical protein
MGEDGLLSSTGRVISLSSDWKYEVMVTKASIATAEDENRSDLLEVRGLVERPAAWKPPFDSLDFIRWLLLLSGTSLRIHEPVMASGDFPNNWRT